MTQCNSTKILNDNHENSKILAATLFRNHFFQSQEKTFASVTNSF